MSAAAGREWRQFEILSRDRVRAMLNAALFSRDADPMLFAIWVGAVVTAVPFIFASQQSLTYAALRAADPFTVQMVLLSHRLFFVSYGMLAALLVTALTWEALFPSSEDLDIIGVLPVRPRTVAAAYLRAAVSSGLVFCVATSLPGAVMFSMVSTSVTGLASMPRTLVAHIVATTAASSWVLFSLLTLRGALAIGLGSRLSLRVGTLLQFLAIVALVGLLFFLPGLMRQLAPAMLLGDPLPLAATPVFWFVALFEWVAGADRPAFGGAARRGLGALVLASGLVVAVFLLPAGIVRRRAATVRERARANQLSALARGVAAVLLRSPVSRAIFVFAVASVSRSRRHALLLATYLGLACAFILITLLATVIRRGAIPVAPAVPLVALPLVLMFFLVLGLRAAFAVPTDVEANWPFRLADPGARRAANATRACLLAGGVLPAPLLTVAGGLAIGWTMPAVVMLAIFQVACGALLVEGALYSCNKTPFTCAHAADPDTVRSGWLLGLGLLMCFAFANGAVQVAALRSGTGAGVYVGATLGIACAIHFLRRRSDDRLTLQYDVPAGERELLNLSEALR